MGDFDEDDFDERDCEELLHLALEKIDPYQNDHNAWRDKQGNLTPIKDMETSHIINCMKMLERMAFARISGYRPEIKRKMAAVAIHDDKQYQNMEKELYSRFKKGKVILSDFFFSVRLGKKKVRLS